MTKTPEFIRVKRRRDEDSVQALLIDEDQKVKKARFVFKLTKTVNQNSYEDEREATTPLLKLANDDHKHFVLEQHKRKRENSNSNSDTENEQIKNNIIESNLPPEITQMVDSYLKLQTDSDDTNSAGARKKPNKKHYLNQVGALPSQDYVYDIYHLEEVPETELINYNTRDDIGFVKIVNKYIELLPDASDDDEDQGRSDDEDSNEENYYQNDYPEDEDDDRSILFGSEGEQIADEEGEVNREAQVSELRKWGVIPSNLEEWEAVEQDQQADVSHDEYSELFNQLKDSENVLYSISKSNIVDFDSNNTNIAYTDEDNNIEVTNEVEMDGSNDEDEYERNTFFETDEDDPLAQHRDKIFTELQNMIDK